MKYEIVLLPGDGIGPEVTEQARLALEEMGRRFSFELSFQTALIGGAAIDQTGGPLPEDTLAACRKADAVLLGAVGGPRWDALPTAQRPEAGLLGIRKALGLFANLRPAQVYPELAGLSRLRPDLVEQGVDLVVVRELTGDVYFGEPAGAELRNGVRYAFNNMIYNEAEVRRIARVGFDLARGRRKRLTSVDKANVLEVSRLWRDVVEEVHKDYPDVTLDHLYVDNAAMQLISAPSSFDVLLTGNIFGDILSDEAAAVVGSLGLLPSASVGAAKAAQAGDKAQTVRFGLYEPVHGSAPDLAGQDKANPLAAILSAAMLLRLSLGQPEAAAALEAAVRKALSNGGAGGLRTPDLRGNGQAGAERVVGCREMGRAVLGNL